MRGFTFLMISTVLGIAHGLRIPVAFAGGQERAVLPGAAPVQQVADRQAGVGKPTPLTLTVSPETITIPGLTATLTGTGTTITVNEAESTSTAPAYTFAIDAAEPHGPELLRVRSVEKRSDTVVTVVGPSTYTEPAIDTTITDSGLTETLSSGPTTFTDPGFTLSETLYDPMTDRAIAGVTELKRDGTVTTITFCWYWASAVASPTSSWVTAAPCPGAPVTTSTFTGFTITYDAVTDSDTTVPPQTFTWEGTTQTLDASGVVVEPTSYWLSISTETRTAAAAKRGAAAVTPPPSPASTTAAGRATPSGSTTESSATPNVAKSVGSNTAATDGLLWVLTTVAAGVMMMMAGA